MTIIKQPTESGRDESPLDAPCAPRRRGRPPRQRCVASLPPVALFAPAGIPLRLLERVTVGVDELEAMRLVDAEGLSQEDAAAFMGVSRQTVGRVLMAGRGKMVQALTHGWAIGIEGGAFRVEPSSRDDCPHRHARPGDGRGCGCRRHEKETGTHD